MSKEVEHGRIAKDFRYIEVGDVAQVRTSDDMAYIFRRRKWEDKWHFSHRAKWDDTGFKENDKNHRLPRSVKEWADEHLGNWGYVTGEPEYEPTMGDDCIEVRGVFKSPDDS